jgi:hypothetical protein
MYIQMYLKIASLASTSEQEDIVFNQCHITNSDHDDRYLCCKGLGQESIHANFSRRDTKISVSFHLYEGRKQ